MARTQLVDPSELLTRLYALEQELGRLPVDRRTAAVGLVVDRVRRLLPRPRRGGGTHQAAQVQPQLEIEDLIRSRASKR